MALGLSGSNGGITKAYRQFGIADIMAGLQKYKTLLPTVPDAVKPDYQKIVDCLEGLHRDLKESELIKRAGG